MKSILLAAAVIGLAATASAQGAKSPVEQALSGSWKCVAEASGMKVTSTVVYLPDGKETYEIHLIANGGQLEFTGTGTAIFTLLPDGNLAETITSLTLNTAKLGGQDAAVATVQSLVEPSILNKASVSRVELKDGAMILTDKDGVVTTCER